VIFSNYELREIVRHGRARMEIGQLTWKPLDRRSVEVLIAQPLDQGWSPRGDGARKNPDGGTGGLT
jgi:hypothetical protein